MRVDEKVNINSSMLLTTKGSLLSLSQTTVVREEKERSGAYSILIG